jgi:hypothetical protein
LQDELARLDESIDRMEREARAVEVAIQIREDWFQRVEVSEKLEKLGKPVTLPERAVERIDALQADRRVSRADGTDPTAPPSDRRGGGGSTDQPIAVDACRTDRAICEHGPWIGSLEDQVQRLHEEIGELEQSLRVQWEQLGLAPGEMPEITPDFRIAR